MYDPTIAPRSISQDLRQQLETDLVHVWGMAQNGTDTDRTLAIVATAFLEAVLTETIAVRLPILDDEIRTTLFDPQRNAPLSAYTSKVCMARAMFVVDGAPYQDLKLIGRIRNQFAHNVRVTSFDHEAVLPQVSKLRAHARLLGLVDESKLPQPTAVLDTTPRGRFAFAVGGLAAGLLNCAVTDAGFGAACLR